MNWILGYHGFRDDSHEARSLRELAPNGSVEWVSDRSYVAGGGRNGTFAFRRIEPAAADVKGWVVIGLGMTLTDGRFRPLREDEWNERLTAPQPDLSDLDGHFCAVRWREGRVDFFNDPLGLRTIFIAHRQSGTFFSTNLEWLYRVLGKPVLDYGTVGAQWFGRAELGSRTAVKGVVRLAQGAVASTGSDGFQIRDRPFTIDVDQPGEPEDILVAIANPWFGANAIPSLACSGGLDSRVQLAAMLQAGTPVRLHNYGPEDHPDVELSLRISRLAGLPIDRMVGNGLLADISQTQRHARLTHAYSPASTVEDWRHYEALDRQDVVVMDASLGELGRCFFYRDLRKGDGARALRCRTGRQVALIQRQSRPDVFSRSIRSVMLAGLEEAVQNVIDGLPNLESADDLADVLMLRLEAPRYAGYAASRIDDLATGYFAFAQPTLIRSLLQTSPSRRRFGRGYRDFIRRVAPELATLPLVRNGPFVSICPFGLSGRKAAAWSLAMRLMGRAWKDHRTSRFLRALEEPIRDLVRATPTRQFEVYDAASLELLVDGFFDGRHNDAGSLDRWLSFELWRLGLIGVEL